MHIAARFTQDAQSRRSRNLAARAAAGVSVHAARAVQVVQTAVMLCRGHGGSQLWAWVAAHGGQPAGSTNVACSEGCNTIGSHVLDQHGHHLICCRAAPDCWGHWLAAVYLALVCILCTFDMLECFGMSGGHLIAGKGLADSSMPAGFCWVV